jgi:hypothetical protein
MSRSLGFYQELCLFNKSWGGDNSGEALERLQREESPDWLWGARPSTVSEVKVHVSVWVPPAVEPEVQDFFALAITCPSGCYK